MSKKIPKVSIIIVNWNGIDVLKDCLKSLLKITYANWDLVVVDNGSKDGSQEIPTQIIELRVPIKVIQNKQNVGFAEANNQGAKASTGEYILLLNNDTKVTEGLLEPLVEKMELDTSIGALQPKIFLMEKPTYLDNTGSFFTFTGFLEHEGFMQKDSSKFDQEQEVFSAKGACLLIRRDVVKKIGLFDDSFGSYFEETDFCWRAWMFGYRVIYYPKTYILHKLGATSKRLKQTTVNYHAFKNRIATLMKNLDSRNLGIVLPIHITLIVILAFYYLLKLEFDKVKMLLKAVLWNVINLKKILHKRKFLQKNRSTTDCSFAMYNEENLHCHE